MRQFIFAAIAAFLAGLSPASAQNDLNSIVETSARSIYASCARMSAASGMNDVRAACACITGYMGGALNDRDYEVAATLLRVGEMAETGASQTAIEAEIMAFFERGFTEADVNRVAGLVQQMGVRGDVVCGQFEPRGSV